MYITNDLKLSREAMQAVVFPSPVGELLIKATDEHLIAVHFMHAVKRRAIVPAMPEQDGDDLPVITDCKQQLREYFEGKRFEFNLPVHQEGSAFQQQVWSALLAIPYGRTISYMELSKRIGNVKAIRAVGTSNGNNNISIIVPCHRVIGRDGSLTGYGGDLWRKKWLLDHEARYANGVQTLF